MPNCNLETIYYLCAGPGLLLAAVIGLWQLRLTKQGHRLVENRAALSATVEQISVFTRRILPIFDNFEEALSSHRVDFYDRVTVRLSNGGVALHIDGDEPPAMNWVPEVFADWHEGLCSLLAWSVPFTSGVADEKLGYEVLGVDFCNCARLAIPLILLQGKADTFQHLITLYVKWSARIEQEDLTDVVEQMTQRLAELKQSQT